MHTITFNSDVGCTIGNGTTDDREKFWCKLHCLFAALAQRWHMSCWYITYSVVMNWKQVGKFGQVKVMYEGSHGLPRLQGNDKEKMRVSDQLGSKEIDGIYYAYKLRENNRKIIITHKKIYWWIKVPNKTPFFCVYEKEINALIAIFSLYKVCWT